MPISKNTERRPRDDRWKNSKGVTVLWTVAALLFVGALVAFALTGGGDSGVRAVAAVNQQSNAVNTDVEPVDVEPVEVQPVPAPPLAAPASEPLTLSEPEVTATAEPTAEPVAADPELERAAVIGADSPQVPLGAPENYAILSAGKVYMRGSVLSLDEENGIVASLELIIGKGNVISEYSIDPEAPTMVGAQTAVYVADAILFDNGSAVISPEFYPVIAPAPFLLELQPTAEITILGYTDSAGDATSNLLLSQERVDAVRDWIIAQGGDGDRIIAIGKGEADPVASNATEDGRRENRRVTFLVDGFDFGA